MSPSSCCNDKVTGHQRLAAAGGGHRARGVRDHLHEARQQRTGGRPCAVLLRRHRRVLRSLLRHLHQGVAFGIKVLKKQRTPRCSTFCGLWQGLEP